MSHDEDDDDTDFEGLFRKARKDPNVLRVGKVFIDIKGTVVRQVACADGLCMQKGGMKSLSGKTCCTTFRVPLEPDDINRVAPVVNEVKKIRDVAAAIDEADGWWHHDSDGLWLEQREHGGCVFLSKPPEGMPRCTIHEWAVKQGHDFRAYKPEGCCLFPMYLIDDGEHVLVTSYGSPYMLYVDEEEADNIKSFACTEPPPGVGRPLLCEFEEELNYRLGTKRWGKALRKLRERGHPV